jgi:chromosome segregation ATPase
MCRAIRRTPSGRDFGTPATASSSTPAASANGSRRNGATRCERRDRKRQQAERLRESIEHDEGNVSRWQDTIYNLRPGGRADEIRDDLESRISDVEDKIRSKRRRLDELEDSISDIEARLYR